MANPFSVTVNVHDAVRDVASEAWHLTGVAPSGNVAPDPGEQVVVTGSAPFVTVGSENVTGWVGVATLLTVTSAGQEICGASAGVGSVPGRLPPQASHIAEPQMTARRRDLDI
jgi:hypothetical protein